MTEQGAAVDAPSGRARHLPAGSALASALLLPLIAAILLWGAGSMALIDPDEGRNAEVAREMAASGDFIVPHLNGLPYLDKPVLFFGAAAASIRALGATELAVRVPALLSTLACVGLVTVFGWQRFGRETGLLAGLMLASSPLVLAYAGIAIFDAPMALWISAAAVGFHLHLLGRHSGWCIAGWAATGLAVLTKGPVGLLLPLLIGVGEALACRLPMRRLFHPAGVAVFVLLVLPWFLAVTLRHPEFPHYAFVRETFERVATDSMRRTAPLYYFLPILLGGTFPWSTVLLAGTGKLVRFWRERAGSARDETFLLLWLVLPTLFFTLSQSKRPGYILPVIPALALLGARIATASPTSLRYAVWVAAPITAMLAVGLLLGIDALGARTADLPLVPEALRTSVTLLGGGLVLAAVAALLGRWSRTVAATALALVPILFLLGGQPVLQAVAESRSARALAQTIRQAAPEGARIIGINVFPPSLPYYLETKIELATVFGTELKSNFIREYLEPLREWPGTTLRAHDWWSAELAHCPRPTVYLLSARSGWERQRQVLEARLPLLYLHPLYRVYGPCRSDVQGPEAPASDP